MSDLTGKAKAKATAESLRNKEIDESVEEATMVKDDKKDLALKESLAMVQQNEELMEMYKENKDVGIKNVMGTGSPLLKVYTLKKSKAELADGSRPQDGFFYYKPTQEEFESVFCHLLSVSEGFRTPPLNPKPGEKDKFNQLMAGVLVDGNNRKPFVLYLNGLKLSPMWEFMSEEMAKYTKNPGLPIPMFALLVQLTTRSVKHEYGESWVIDYNIVMNEDNTPKVVTDPGEFQFLRDTVNSMEDLMDSIIASKMTEEEAEDQPPHPAEVVGEEVNISQEKWDGEPH